MVNRSLNLSIPSDKLSSKVSKENTSEFGKPKFGKFFPLETLLKLRINVLEDTPTIFSSTKYSEYKAGKKFLSTITGNWFKGRDSPTNPKSPSRNKSNMCEIISEFHGPMGESIVNKMKQMNPILIKLVDESHKHRGHAGVRDAKTEETHFDLTVVSSMFDGMRQVKRHQYVYKLLALEFKQGLHALSLSLHTPEEAQKE